MTLRYRDSTLCRCFSCLQNEKMTEMAQQILQVEPETELRFRGKSAHARLLSLFTIFWEDLKLFSSKTIL